MIQVKQILANSAREGARLAAQGYTLDSAGLPLQVYESTGSLNVKDTVYNYLLSMGLTKLQKTDVTVDFAFTSNLGAPGTLNNVYYPGGVPNPAGTPNDPYLGLKGQPLKVTVTIPWAKVRWINAGVINPTSLTVTVKWEMLRDDTFAVDTQLPQW